MNSWTSNSVFYHIYPLGFCDAPQRNDFNSLPMPRLARIHEWIPHMQYLGVNALYLGPLFESSTHGYDTADYFHVDRRLGTAEDLRALVSALQIKGIRVILDGVFNHTGRDFFAFKDIRANGPASKYRGWYKNLRFDTNTPSGDNFTYDTWNGHCSLPKLNLSSMEVRDHLLNAVSDWIRNYNIDGLRLDAADCIDPDFLRHLSAFSRGIKPGFWLLGEAVHGDYRKLSNPDCLDSVTNYEAYKGLYSSFNDVNMFEIAYTLNRQYGPAGIYRNIRLYNFADNHDVNRLAATLKYQPHIYPLYCLLFAMPGIPSLYYGSEGGAAAVRAPGSDWPVRPHIDLNWLISSSPHKDLIPVISKLAGIRGKLSALTDGEYRQLSVSPGQLAFLRRTQTDTAVVFINSSREEAKIDVDLREFAGKTMRDELNPGWKLKITGGKTTVAIDPCWARIATIK